MFLHGLSALLKRPKESNYSRYKSNSNAAVSRSILQGRWMLSPELKLPPLLWDNRDEDLFYTHQTRLVKTILDITRAYLFI